MLRSLQLIHSVTPAQDAQGEAASVFVWPLELPDQPAASSPVHLMYVISSLLFNQIHKLLNMLLSYVTTCLYRLCNLPLFNGICAKSLD
jgi:hypothetical protein